MIPAHVEHARALKGLRWRHRGRGMGKLDCVGLVVVAFARAGRALNDRKHYGRSATRDKLREALVAEFGQPVARDPQPGDIGLFVGTIYPHHVAIFGDYFLGGLSLIHASNEPGVMKVAECRFAGEWEKRLLAVFDWQGTGR